MLTLTALACLLLLGLLAAKICSLLRLPRLVGLLLTGIILGPYCLNLITPQLLTISPDLRQFALVVILLRAGLSLDLNDLKKVGRPALLLACLPASFELVAYTLLAPRLLGCSYLEAALVGAVLAAVSPAVVVPQMLNLMEKGLGVKQAIPQMILAGSSLDDIYVIVLFSSFLNMAQGGTFAFKNLLQVPLSILLGALLGIISAYLYYYVQSFYHHKLMGLSFLKKSAGPSEANTRIKTSFSTTPNMPTSSTPQTEAKTSSLRKIASSVNPQQALDVKSLLIFLGSALLLLEVEAVLKPYVAIASLLGIMVFAIFYRRLAPTHYTDYLKNCLQNIWSFAEICLFTLVGAAVDIKYTLNAGLMALILIFAALVARSLGVMTCLIKTKLDRKERLFCCLAYLPKATVQAAIGSIPLACHLACGPLVLAVAVLGILVTAPLGAFLIEFSSKKLLKD